MSAIDTRLPDDLRALYLEEIKSWLPGFLGAATTERLDPLEQIGDLLSIGKHELRGVVAVHVLLHPAVVAFLEALPAGLRSPATGSHRPREESHAVSGGIDWAATIRVRATGSPLEPALVTRPARRLFDVPANRVLAWTLAQLHRLSSQALAALPASPPAHWAERIGPAADLLSRSQRVSWLRTVPAARPAASDFAALAASRSYFQRVLLRRAAACVRLFTEDPSPEDVTDLLVRRWFQPTRDWQLFELTVLLRLERALSRLGQRQRIKPLGSRRGPFAAIEVSAGGVARIWYQSWPAAASVSEHMDAAEHYSVPGAGSRPDIVIEYVHGTRSIGWVLELKATSSGTYLSEGLLQLLGYVRDRADWLQDRVATAWLVAPSGGPFNPRHPDDRQLWVVGANEVAAEALAAIEAVVAGVGLHAN